MVKCDVPGAGWTPQTMALFKGDGQYDAKETNFDFRRDVGLRGHPGAVFRAMLDTPADGAERMPRQFKMHKSGLCHAIAEEEPI